MASSRRHATSIRHSRLAALPELLAMQEPPDAWFVGLARPAVAAWREA